MKTVVKPNWFDLFMLLLALLPFLVVWLLPGLNKLGGLPSDFVIPLYVICVPGCLGFPTASILYFVWRFKSGKVSALRVGHG
jgi:hypothetical protein